MLIIASCAFAQDAEFLIKQYKKMKGADYENITKKVKKDAKKAQYTNPKYYNIAKKIEKVHYVAVQLNEDEREVLTKNIENIDGYTCLYQQKNNTENIMNSKFTLFPNRQYYGIEEGGEVKEGIIRVDYHAGGTLQTLITHIVGNLTMEEVMSVMGFEEHKNISPVTIE